MTSLRHARSFALPVAIVDNGVIKGGTAGPLATLHATLGLVSANENGRFTVTNGRTGWTKIYD